MPDNTGELLGRPAENRGIIEVGFDRIRDKKNSFGFRRSRPGLPTPPETMGRGKFEPRSGRGFSRTARERYSRPTLPTRTVEQTVELNEVAAGRPENRASVRTSNSYGPSDAGRTSFKPLRHPAQRPTEAHIHQDTIPSIVISGGGGSPAAWPRPGASPDPSSLRASSANVAQLAGSHAARAGRRSRPARGSQFVVSRSRLDYSRIRVLRRGLSRQLPTVCRVSWCVDHRPSELETAGAGRRIAGPFVEVRPPFPDSPIWKGTASPTPERAAAPRVARGAGKNAGLKARRSRPRAGGC